MNRFVILRIAQGSFETGFTVICQIGVGLQQPHIEQVGYLPPVPELPVLYQAWRSQYLRLGTLLRLEPQPDQATNLSFVENCVAAANALEQAFNQWLSTVEFRTVREKLLEQLRPEDSIRVLVVTEQGLIQKLPWHLWDLLERYPLAEVGFSLPMTEVMPAQVPMTQGVNILAVLGAKTGLDTKTDRQLLTGLPQATVKVLVEPSRSEFNAHLWDQAWDILFFAGHSTTDANGEGGSLWLNETNALTISDLKYALRKALGAGLQLAIFNSCDGLGLAKALADLRMPHMIVMREPVPDVVARSFLEFFLGAFAHGQSFHLAVREARERLQGLESEFPCATWLPAIVQSPMAIPPSWDSLGGFSQTADPEDCPIASTLVTMVWTDLLESTRIKQHLQGQHTADRNQFYLEQVLQPHRQRVENTARQYGGTIVKTEGDACFLVFNTVAAALNWSIELQKSHTVAPIATPLGNLQVRVGIHTGSPLYSNGDYIGQEVDYLVRLADLAQGSQILVSEATAVLTRNLGFQDLSLHAHGNYLLKGIGNVPVFEILWEHKPPQSPRVDVKALYEQGYLQPVKSEIATAAPRGASLVTPAKKQTALKTLAVLLAGLCSTAVVLGVRSLGGLQSIELWSFDQLMRLRPLEKPDDRLLLITVTAEDLLKQPA
ncbi:MAG TPA: CHAT domain-containing protein, partial [Stenomitos sp.]